MTPAGGGPGGKSRGVKGQAQEPTKSERRSAIGCTRRESKDRVRAAIRHAGFRFPQVKVVINLAPADLPKRGGRFDLPIALGILIASGQLPERATAGVVIVGELGLAGGVARSRGAGSVPDLADVVGQHGARRALEIAAAGEHNLLFCGPPGTGKSMLASRLPGILPPLTESEAGEVAAIASVSQAGFDPASWGRRPFRSPHHTVSGVALVGGGVGLRTCESVQKAMFAMH